MVRNRAKRGVSNHEAPTGQHRGRLSFETALRLLRMRRIEDRAFFSTVIPAPAFAGAGSSGNPVKATSAIDL
jgi:hypothetical protein